MRRHPKTARIVLSGHADSALTMQCAGATHQFLLKPCDSRTLSLSIHRALAASQWQDHEQVRALAGRMTRLPSVPPLYFQILEEMQTAGATFSKVGQLISREPRLAEKFLALVNCNSSEFGRPITDPAQAVMHFGFEIVKSLVLGAHVFCEFCTREGSKTLIERVCRHSMTVAFSARRLCRSEGKDDRFVHESFIAGLFHDLGRLALAANFPFEYAEVPTCCQMQSMPILEAERSIFGITHAELGAYLLGLWGFPGGIVEAAAFHHTPNDCPVKEFSPLSVIHIIEANHNTSIAGVDPALLGSFDEVYLMELGLWARLPQLLKQLKAP